MRSIGTRLGAMMFLQFFIWGAWYTTIAVYMTNHGMATLTFWPYTVNPIAAIAAPFFVGLVADRYFATQKALGTLHLIGGLVGPGRGRDRFGGAAAHHRRGVGYAFRLTNR